MSDTRRTLLGKTVFGAGAIGLRALATGLPVSFLARPLTAMAEDYVCADKNLAPCFSTVQVDPISAGAGDILSIDGRSLPNVAPTGLRDLLTRANTPLNRLQALRDQSVDEVFAVLKDRGTKAQKAYMDNLV